MFLASKLSLGERLYDNFILKDRYMYLIEGVGNTLIITIGALIIGVILGVMLALLKLSKPGDMYFIPQNRLPLVLGWLPYFLKGLMYFLKGFAHVYITVIRGTPIIVQLMLMYFVILKSGAPLVVAILAFGFNSGAYVAEIIRSGIQSIDVGQIEAGRSLGLSSIQTMFRIILPQAFKNVAPAIFNEFIALVKETSVAGYVGIPDLTKGGDIIRSITYDAFPPLLAVAGIYLIIVLILTQILTMVERRLSRSDNR